MKTETKILGIILALTVALLVGGVFFLSKQSTSNDIKDATVYQIDYSKGQKIGSDSAKVKLVEFSDFECPACAAASNYTKKYESGENPDIQFIYRHFPLPQHESAKKAALVAEAAGEQGKFWQMHDKLFETQFEWEESKDSTAFFLSLAKELGLDEEKIKKAIEENTYAAKIDADLSEGRSLGVNSTPTFYLNGRKLNLKSFADLNTAVEEELKKSN